ncbi:MAG: transcriptional regulator NrdR [Acidaminococcus sp.]|jgi:transcriptional repressor NrdR|nr:transcriptional regulator NrdR [Acidaminococcus sp.]MCI2100136.1 transcriptional regulator NrdR [Acidaminococcus sp.]MCI2114455.1 transcriptional regulator NrdR [Acidaminococcus sp.]MCI2116390.1 transcriptional regulator NrdR [Acidaminococcus sp.]
MKCPFCSYEDSRVIDSRSSDNGTAIRRRRECPKCGRRFTTYEKYEVAPLLVIKKDGRREMFDSQKLIAGLLRAFEKRPFSYDQIKGIASEVEAEIRTLGENEVKSSLIGETVMKHLEKVDQIAYVRFASVYRQFADVNSFMQEIQNMLHKEIDGGKKGKAK